MADRGRLLDHLLMAALKRAFALEQRHHIAVGVAKHLHFDMPGLGNIFLDQNLVVAEGRTRFALGARNRLGEFVGGADDPHAPASAAGRCLDQDRIADRIGGRLQRLGTLILAVIARHDRDAGGFHQRLGCRFRTHQADGRGRRADENQSRFGAGLREIGILGEKAVTRMDRLGASRARRIDDRLDMKVAVLRRRRADEDGLVGEVDVHGIAIGLREHHDRGQAHAPCRAYDPARDLAAVGDQQLLEAPDQRHHHILKMPKRVGSGGGALSPAASARLSTMRVSAGSMTPSSHSRAVA